MSVVESAPAWLHRTEIDVVTEDLNHGFINWYSTIIHIVGDLIDVLSECLLLTVMHWRISLWYILLITV